ncbi:MAG: hypothetical protein OER80_07480 [Gammaproteobacteria bacterium]|nr:hypothetical protein [Gammaproteobacteria bacterium]MDH3768648.1 hypothetical protein [Gammaproteobacteria bacterium]
MFNDSNIRLYRVIFVCMLALGNVACDAAGKQKTLGINVRGSVSVQPTEFSGHYIYVDIDGTEVRRQLNGSGNLNEVVQGTHVRLATLRRTSPQGVIGLVITSNGNIIYDSGMLQTNDLIVYEAP